MTGDEGVRGVSFYVPQDRLSSYCNTSQRHERINELGTPTVIETRLLADEENPVLPLTSTSTLSLDPTPV